MGTRCLTFVYDGDEKIINMYRQFDGYPTGHGQELAQFLNSGKMTNGLTFGDTGIKFNGAGCLAAQLVGYFKQEAGQFYLHPVTALDCGQDFEYHVHVNGGDISIRVMSCGVNFFGSTQSDVYETIFDGSLAEFTKFCANEEQTEEAPKQTFEDSIVSREVLKKQLQEGIMNVVFTKVDGTERTMKATLSNDYVPLMDTTAVKQKHTPNPDVLAVWDVDANGWRSFRFDSIKKVS